MPANNYNTLGPNRTNRGRVGGSGYTVFAWDNGGAGSLVPLGFARQISHQSPTPVGPGTVPIHPMDEPYPVELITAMATTMGTVTLELYELFGEPVWVQLAGLSGTSTSGSDAPVDLAGIFRAIANADKAIRIVKFIREPKRGARGGKVYTEEYNNCVVSQLMDGETIEVGTMEVLKQIVVNYTHITRDGGRNGMLGSGRGQLGIAPGAGINNVGQF